MTKLGLYLLTISVLISCDQYSSAPILSEPFDRDAHQVIAYLNDKQEDGVNTDDLYFKRAEAYLDLDSSWKALSDIDTALLKATENAEYHYLKGRILDKLDRNEQAINELLVAEKLGLTNYDVYSSLTQLYLKNEEFDKALAVSDRMLNLQNTEQAHLLKAEVYLSLNDTTKAIRSYQAALTTNPNYVEAAQALTKLRLEKKQYNQAKVVIQQFLSSNPRNQNFIHLLAQYYLRTANYDSARNQLFVLYEEDTSDLTVINELAASNYELNDYDSSNTWINKSLALDSNQLSILLLRARTLDQLRQYELAKSQYENILKSDSTVQIAREELDILNRKIAYLWRIEERRMRQDSLISNPPPVIRKKKIE